MKTKVSRRVGEFEILAGLLLFAIWIVSAFRCLPFDRFPVDDWKITKEFIFRWNASMRFFSPVALPAFYWKFNDYWMRLFGGSELAEMRGALILNCLFFCSPLFVFWKFGKRIGSEFCKWAFWGHLLFGIFLCIFEILGSFKSEVVLVPTLTIFIFLAALDLGGQLSISFRQYILGVFIFGVWAWAKPNAVVLFLFYGILKTFLVPKKVRWSVARFALLIMVLIATLGLQVGLNYARVHRANLSDCGGGHLWNAALQDLSILRDEPHYKRLLACANDDEGRLQTYFFKIQEQFANCIPEFKDLNSFDRYMAEMVYPAVRKHIAYFAYLGIVSGAKAFFRPLEFWSQRDWIFLEARNESSQTKILDALARMRSALKHTFSILWIVSVVLFLIIFYYRRFNSKNRQEWLPLIFLLGLHPLYFLSCSMIEAPDQRYLIMSFSSVEIFLIWILSIYILKGFWKNSFKPLGRMSPKR